MREKNQLDCGVGVVGPCYWVCRLLGLGLPGAGQTKEISRVRDAWEYEGFLEAVQTEGSVECIGEGAGQRRKSVFKWRQWGRGACSENYSGDGGRGGQSGLIVSDGAAEKV